MTARIPESVLDKAEELYKQGLSFREISEIVGRSDETLRKRLKERGVQMRKTSQGRQAPNAIMDLPEIEIIHSYEMGRSENSLAMHFGVSRNVIRRILNKHNIHVRNQSESEKLKWSQMTDEQRENQIIKAHAAVKGTPRSNEAKRNLAISREKNTPDWYIGCGEPEFKKWREDEGISFEYQKAVEFYNVDFLIDGIAIELTSFVGRNRLTRPDFMNRALILKEQGIKTLAVEFRNERELMSHAYSVINMANKLRGNHFTGHYIAYRLQFLVPDVRILA